MGQQNERQPTPKELTETLEITAEKVSELGHSGRHILYDSPFSSEEDHTLPGVLQNKEPGKDKGLMRESLSIEVARSMKVLGDKEREVLTLFFGLGDRQPHSMEEIGDKYDFFRERVRQIKDMQWPGFKPVSAPGC